MHDDGNLRLHIVFLLQNSMERSERVVFCMKISIKGALLIFFVTKLQLCKTGRVETNEAYINVIDANYLRKKLLDQLAASVRI